MRVQLDNKNDWTGIAMHPVDNMPNYGADIADVCSALLLSPFTPLLKF
jgi:hypothetical protein